MGSCGWFIHDISQWVDTLYPCGTYWDSRQNGISQWYWANNEVDASNACLACFFNGRPGQAPKSQNWWVRSTRCVPS